jgi:hypothetical protein
MPRYRVSVVTFAHAVALLELRLLAFSKSPQFVWRDPAKLGWTPTDDEAVVFGVWCAGRLVATSRVYLRANRAQAEQAIEYDLTELPPERFPCLIAGRSATHPEHANIGLSGVLRLAMIESLLGPLAYPIRSILAVVYDGAPRVRSLRMAGYDCFACARHWDSEATAQVPPLLVNLAASNFRAALVATKDSFGELLTHTSFDRDAITARFGTVLELAMIRRVE